MVYLSSSCIKNANILNSIAELSVITKNIELSGGSNIQDGLLEQLLELQRRGYNFLVHGYFPPPRDHFLLNFADESVKTREFILNSLNYAKKLGIPYYSTHAGFVSDFTIGKIENLEGGAKQFEYSGIQKNTEWFFENSANTGLALENLFPNHGDKDCCFWMKPECITKALDVDHRLSLLLDLGHLKISAKSFGFSWEEACDGLLKFYMNRIKEIHISENNGELDEHLPIKHDSFQVNLIKKYAADIKKYGINITVEAREASISDLQIMVNLLEKTLEE